MYGMARDNDKETVPLSYRFCSHRKNETIILDEISQTNIDAAKLKFQQLFATTKSVKDTQKLYNVVAIRPDVIECRMYGNETSKWTVFF